MHGEHCALYRFQVAIKWFIAIKLSIYACEKLGDHEKSTKAVSISKGNSRFLSYMCVCQANLVYIKIN